MVEELKRSPSRKYNKTILKNIEYLQIRIPSIIKDLFTLTKKEQEEYDNAKDTRELADICIRDCRKYGSRLLKQEIEEGAVVKENG